MKLLVTGSRSWPDKQAVYNVLTELNPTLVIHGGATGADAFAEQWAVEHDVLVDRHPADWGKYGRAAGAIRNAQMVNEKPDLVVAFLHGNSPGTRMTMKMAEAAGIPVRLCQS